MINRDIFDKKYNRQGFSLNRYIRITALFLIVLESIGIRFFEGQGTMLSILILILSAQGFSKLKNRDYLILTGILLYLCFNKLINASFDTKAFIFQLLLILVAYIFLIQYRYRKDLLDDFYIVLKIICLQALIGYFFFILFIGSSTMVNFGAAQYRTIAHIFYVDNTSFAGLHRNTGICWEPGLMQLVFNFFLFLNIQRRARYIYIFLIVIGVITTFSTSGYIILGLNFFYFLSKNFSEKNAFILVFAILISSFFFGLIYQNITLKLSDTNISGIVRLRDYFIGVNLIEEKPIFGHGIFTTDYLLTKPYVGELESSLFSKGYINLLGGMSGGYTNGLLGLASWFGIPVALILYYLFYRNKIIVDTKIPRFIFFMIFIITFISEPITYSPLFLLFPFSTLILNKYKMKQQKAEELKLNRLYNYEL